MLLVPSSVGDAIDRLTILDIKRHKITDPVKKALVIKEYEALRDVVKRDVVVDTGSVYDTLKRVNERLWDVEDAIRAMDNDANFGPEFVALARAVYILNDERARLKRHLNDMTGSEFVEVKSYSPKLSKLFMVPHMGMGDTVVLTGLIRVLALHPKVDTILYPVKKQYTRASQALLDVPKVTVLPFDDEAACFKAAHEHSWMGYVNVPLGMHSLDPKSWNALHPDFSHRFYIQAGIDHKVSYTHFAVTRCPEAERDLYDRVVAKYGTTYVFVHEDVDRGFVIDRSHVPKLPVFSAHDPDIYSDSIIDYAMVMEHATELHVMDSCFALLADRLPEVTCPIVCHAYAKPEPPHPSLYIKNVRFVYPRPEEMVSPRSPEPVVSLGVHTHEPSGTKHGLDKQLLIQ